MCIKKLFTFAGKEACFDRIVQRFGRRSTFVVVGKSHFCLIQNRQIRKVQFFVEFTNFTKFSKFAKIHIFQEIH